MYGREGEFNAKCTDVTKISFDGEALEEPYPCDPTDQSKMCQYDYIAKNDDATEGDKVRTFFEYKCQCALDGDSGFCGTVFGTQIMKNNVQHIVDLLSNNECHTLDRND